MNKELTPMMELIEMCKTLMENSTNKAVYETANIIKFRAEKELLPKEKQVIEDAFYSAVKITGEGWNGEYAGGNYPCIEEDFKDNFETYYNTKYNNQIK